MNQQIQAQFPFPRPAGATGKVSSKESRPMMWSSCRGAVVTIVACASLAWAQAPAPQTGAGERTMTLQENGKSVRCRILSDWKTPEGARAYQVQAIETGEMITIVADGADSRKESGTGKAAP